MITDDLEKYLKDKEKNDFNILTVVKDNNPERLRADKGASLDDMIVMISGLVAKIMKKEKVEFKPDEGVRLEVDQAANLDHPYIFFKIIDCKHANELKPRVRESISEVSKKSTEIRQGEIYGQLFDCIIQFDILARDYKEASKVMNIFEDTIFSYTAYLKQNGVAEILFTRRLTDKDLDVYRQKCSVRSLQYFVRIEKLFTFFNSEISDITVS